MVRIQSGSQVKAKTINTSINATDYGLLNGKGQVFSIPPADLIGLKHAAMNLLDWISKIEEPLPTKKANKLKELNEGKTARLNRIIKNKKT